MWKKAHSDKEGKQPQEPESCKDTLPFSTLSFIAPDPKSLQNTKHRKMGSISNPPASQALGTVKGHLPSPKPTSTGNSPGSQETNHISHEKNCISTIYNFPTELFICILWLFCLNVWKYSVCTLVPSEVRRGPLIFGCRCLELNPGTLQE